MNSVMRDIFRAIHEGKWLKIEYRNKDGQETKYWIGITNLNVARRSLEVDGLHLGEYTVKHFDFIYIDSILSSKIIEGSYCEINKRLVEDISENPHKYKSLFDNIANLKILNYLEACNKMDSTPYYTDYKLIRYLDRDSLNGKVYQLNNEQFKEIVNNFENKTKSEKRHDGRINIQQLAINVMSINTYKGLYVLAYRKLNLDVKRKLLEPDEDITICTEYTIDGSKQSIRYFLDAEDFSLLENFEANQELIKDCITSHNSQEIHVDDMPYLIGIGMDIAIDLHSEYQAIIDMYNSDKVTFPIRAFFGDLLERPKRSKAYPIALLNKNINLDQLLAINNAMKYPIAYVQGPPGTGKTNTIINTIVTAFFNDMTVLFSSYNNIPIDGVFNKLSALEYKGKTIPFPVLRLGNNEKMREAIIYIRDIYEASKNISVYSDTLDKRKDDRKDRAKRLSALLKSYEDKLDFIERKETINRMLDKDASINLIPFQTDLQGRQLAEVDKKITELGDIKEENAIELLDNNENEFYQYLYFTSARYIQQLGEPKFDSLMNIVYSSDEDKRLEAFNKYISKSENIKKLQRVFPIMITTCISAHKIGEPKPLFDMVIMDEASQCNTAVSLVPIIRGEKLMLVGDPQQLSPVILLDEITNQKLRKKYRVSNEYDYRKNSIYKTFLACDSVSDEVLLHNHYRCHKKIAEFNNRKYYNSKLNICTKSKEDKPLELIDIPKTTCNTKNTSPAEVDEIIKFVKNNKDKSIGIITPFVNQKNMIAQALKENKLENVDCGTVHAFQGDEKDIILFSSAITDNTREGTYEWLKNNKELINVATSRAKDKLIVLTDSVNLERLYQNDNDDFYELVQYVKKNGDSKVTRKHSNSRALGIKPFSTATEEAFMENLKHALENIWLSQSKYTVQKEVAISQVFQGNTTGDDLFYMGRFDFVVYEKQDKMQIPVLAIELDGMEHFEDDTVIKRDEKKNRICAAHNLQMIRVENSYARRYNHIKEILLEYFRRSH